MSAFFFLKALETQRLGYYVLFGMAAGPDCWASIPTRFCTCLILAAASDPAWRTRLRLVGLVLCLSRRH